MIKSDLKIFSIRFFIKSCFFGFLFMTSNAVCQAPKSRATSLVKVLNTKRKKRRSVSTHSVEKCLLSDALKRIKSAFHSDKPYLVSCVYEAIAGKPARLTLKKHFSEYRKKSETHSIVLDHINNSDINKIFEVRAKRSEPEKIALIERKPGSSVEHFKTVAVSSL